MGTIQFDIRHPNGKRESVLIEGERALVGSASYCDVRLPMEDCAPEHVIVEAVGDTLRVEAKVESPAALIDGMPFTGRVLAPESLLAIGRTRLFVTFVPDLSDRPQAAADTKKDWQTIAPIGVLIALALAAYVVLARKPDGIAPPPEKTPQLFTASARTCPHSEATQAVAFAEEQHALADTKRERVPFVASDGVAAVALYEVAAACFHRGGATQRGHDAEEAANSLRSNLTEDFHARRLRLSHVLQVGDFAVATKDVAVLRALTKDHKGPYVEWLASVAQQLAAATTSTAQP